MHICTLNKHLLVVSLILIAAASASAAGNRDGGGPAADQRDGVRVVTAGISGGARPAIHMIRNAGALARTGLSEEHQRIITRETDFATETAVYLQVGTRPTGGYRLALASVQRSESEVRIDVEERRPERDAIVTQALTYPAILLIVSDPPRSIVVNGPQ